MHQDNRAGEALELLEGHTSSETEVPPLLLRARLLQGEQRGEEALPLLKKGIKLHPDDKRLRLAYARQLVELQRMDEAKSEFAGLVQQFPDDDDLPSPSPWSASKPKPGTKPFSTSTNWSPAKLMSTLRTSTSAVPMKNATSRKVR